MTIATAFLAGAVWADCPDGDLNRDCRVDLHDLGLLAGSWLEVEPNLPVGSVVINELLSHAHDTASDWIELYNTTGSAVNISGWYLSDRDSPLTKYPIPNGTIIPAYGYVVFYENVHFGVNHGNNVPFGFSENGESVYLSLLRGGKYIAMDDRKFDASERNVSFGRYTTSTDEVKFVAMSSNTPGAPNAYPKVGPIVISEIMYNYGLDDPNTEYVELYNDGSVPVALQEYDPCISSYVPWKFTQGIDLTFPLGTTIPAHGYIVVVKNRTAFASQYPGVPPGIVFGPYGGQLNNDGEKVEVSKPGDLDVGSGIRYYIRVDMVDYSNGGHHENFTGLDPWPSGPSGEGESLNRIVPNLYGNDVNNWMSDSATPGY